VGARVRSLFHHQRDATQKIGRLTAAHRSRLAPVELTPAGIFDSEDLVEWCWFIFLALLTDPWVP
jgi:hypothetical protein